MSSTVVSREGRYVAHKQGVLSASGDAEAAALDAEMLSHAAQFIWNFRARVNIEPARRQIWSDHRPVFGDFQFLVLNNPFIPPGHEEIFLRGFYYGLAGDFLVASHLLAPQFENSLRYILEKEGVDVSNLESDLTQPVKTLGALLAMPELKKMLGESLVFELRGHLTEKHGYAFRNNIAHGFAEAAECHGEAALNIWWLELHLCYCPLVAESREEQ